MCYAEARAGLCRALVAMARRVLAGVWGLRTRLCSLHGGYASDGAGLAALGRLVGLVAAGRAHTGMRT